MEEDHFCLAVNETWQRPGRMQCSTKHVQTYTCIWVCNCFICSLDQWQGPYLAVRLATHNFHSVPLLLRCALLQLGGPKETHPVHIGAVTALRRGHKGRRNQKDLKRREWHETIGRKNGGTKKGGNPRELMYFGLYLVVLVSDSWRIPNQHLDESWAFISYIDAVHLLLLLELREKQNSNDWH